MGNRNLKTSQFRSLDCTLASKQADSCVYVAKRPDAFASPAHADGPQRLFNPAQEEGRAQSVAEAPGPVQVLLLLPEGQSAASPSSAGSALHLLSSRLNQLTCGCLQKVLLKDVPELSNHIDRSQLTAPLGGYLVYCHHSWVSFIKVVCL